MKNYVRLLYLDLSGKVAEAMGSFSIFKLDGRMTLVNQVPIGYKLLERENGISNNYYIGFRIYQKNQMVMEVLV